MELRLHDNLARKTLLDLLVQLAREAGALVDPRSAHPRLGLLTLLAQLSDGERLRLASFLHSLSISIDPEQLTWAIGNVAKLDGDRARLIELILQDAPYALVRRVFPMSHRAYRTLRERAGLRGKAGRPPLPRYRVQHEIVSAYRALSREHDPAATYLALRDRFPNWTLPTIYQVVARYEAETGEPGGSP